MFRKIKTLAAKSSLTAWIRSAYSAQNFFGSPKRKGSTKMSMKSYLFTSESVTEGHPDKVVDRISDSIRMRFGKDKTPASHAKPSLRQAWLWSPVKSPRLQKSIIRMWSEMPSAMTSPLPSLDGLRLGNLRSRNFLDRQSPDIDMGVSEGKGSFKEQGAGDWPHVRIRRRTKPKR